MGAEMDQARDGFEARNSRDGLFLRYARGRLRSLVLRQTMTVMGSAAIGLMGEGWMGVLAACLVVVGEVLDATVLASILRAEGLGPAMRRAAAISAALQSLTIAASIVLCWRGIPLLEARLFAAVFLMAAAINAGLVRRHFPEGAAARIAVFAVTGLAMLAIDTLQALTRGDRGAWFFALAVLILGYTAVLFIRTVERGHAERLRFERALLAEQGALERSRAALADEARRAQRLALTAQYANDSVIFTDPDGRIEWVNAAFTRTTGYGYDEVVGHLPGEVLNSPSTSLEALRELAEARAQCRPCRLEIENTTKDGRLIWMEISMAPVLRPDGSPDVFIAVERDITEAKAHEAELAAARTAAEAAAQAKSAFLATMSHEIRTPLNGVIGVAELLEETRLDRQQRQYVTTIVESGRALLTIINDVLDLSKLQAGRVELQSDAFLLTDCLTGVARLLQPSAQKKGLALTVDCPADLPAHLGDAGRLRQVLLNLVGNAVKFTPAGRVSLSARASPVPGGDRIEIAVADTGIGIAPDRLGQVFDSFTQADASISRRFGGTGLGLTISRRIVQEMGGDITVSSQQGVGSVFTANFTLARAGDVAVAAPSPPPVAEAPRTRLKLLVAEDNRTNLLIARKLLETRVESLAEAANGRIAVEMYRTRLPDLVLMDVSMPEMDGLDAARAIRAHEAAAGLPRCPIHALTAYSAEAEREACLAAGIDGVLTKPLDRAALFALIDATARARGLCAFDLAPPNGIERAAKGGEAWPTSQPGSTTTHGRLTRSSGR